MRQFLQPQLSEHQIRNQIIEILRYSGYYAWTNNVGALKTQHTDKYGVTRAHMTRFGKPGFSDIFAIQPQTGRFVALEVKRPKTRKNTTRWQEDFINIVKMQGGIAAVVCSVEEVAELLNIKMY